MLCTFVFQFTSFFRFNFWKDGIELLTGVGRFDDDGNMTVNGKTYTAKHYLIAAGGRPKRPDLPGTIVGEHEPIAIFLFRLIAPK